MCVYRNSMENKLFEGNLPIVKARVTTTLNSDLVKLVKIRQWSFQHLLEFAIKFKLAEADEMDYPDNKISLKLAKASQQLTDAYVRIETLEEMLNKDEKKPKKKAKKEEIIDNQIKELLDKK